MGTQGLHVIVSLELGKFTEEVTVELDFDE